MVKLVTPEQTEHHAEILSNRVRKMFRHFSRKFRKQNIECFRLYDWDIPEVRAVVDWYAGHAVVAEYERLQTGPQWLPRMAQSVAEALSLPADRVHIKRRRTNTKDGVRYGRQKKIGERFQARERDLLFWINPEDFLDTGLYSDHRDTRVIVRDLAKGKNILNLYGYTGAFTCAAAAGGARATVTVDRSATYLKWAKDNLALNGLGAAGHTLIRSDVIKYLDRSVREDRRFDLAIVDPPSFSQSRSRGAAFDINEDHPELLLRVFRVMERKATVFFSTNHQRFEPRLEGLPVNDLKELTPGTIPEDYRNRCVHHCWRMTVA